MGARVEVAESSPPKSPGAAVAGVGAVVVRSDGRVLLVQRAHPPRAGTWSLPGGHVDGGETGEAAVVREVLEETGLSVRVLAPLGAVELASEGFRYTIEEFLCGILGSSAARAGDDAADVTWSDAADRARLGVNALALEVIDRGLAALSRLRAAGSTA
jgi:ADP-ribose pyrophosphatase YjhB (NUDIX family)